MYFNYEIFRFKQTKLKLYQNLQRFIVSLHLEKDIQGGFKDVKG